MERKDIKSANFKEDAVAILKEFCTYFECLPVKVDGKLELVSWYCGVCSHHVQQFAEGAQRDCNGRNWGTEEECIAKFYPVTLRHNWLDKLVGYASSMKEKR